MKRLTPQEFFRHFFGWSQNNQININQLSETEHWVLMKAYADHSEETAWVTDGSLPPVDPEDERGASVFVNVVDKDGHVSRDYYRFDLKQWHTYGNTIRQWRPLPPPPKP